MDLGISKISFGDLEVSNISIGDLDITSMYFGYEEPKPTIPPNNEIWYTSTDGQIVTPYNTTGWGANIVSNTYLGGYGRIVFEHDITKTPDYAFEGCLTLESIHIPVSVTGIGEDSFHYCINVNSIDIPGKIWSIGRYAFTQCYSLTSFEFGSGATITAITQSTFSDCRSLKSITLPNRLRIIEEHSFAYCTSLSSITIPNSVTTIGKIAFNKCTSLSSITIPNSVRDIEEMAFWDCTSLSSITICSGGTLGMDDDVFYGCPLQTIYSYKTSAPGITSDTFSGIASGGTLHTPSGSNYNVWLSHDRYYLGYYGWTRVADL